MSLIIDIVFSKSKEIVLNWIQNHKACNAIQKEISQKLCFQGIEKQQANSISKEISSYLCNLNENTTIEEILIKLNNELKIADVLSEKEISTLSDKIIEATLIKYCPRIWKQYNNAKALEESKRIEETLKDHYGIVENKLAEIVSLLQGKVYTIDGFDANVAITWSDTDVHIDLNFFNYDDNEFRTSFRKLLDTPVTDNKYIYIEANTWEEALYATLFELSITKQKDDVLISKDKDTLSKCRLFNQINKIYVLAYDISKFSIPDDFTNGTLIIPMSKRTITGNRESETIKLNARTEHNLYSALAAAGVDKPQSFITNNGRTFSELKAHFCRSIGYSAMTARVIPDDKRDKLIKIILLNSFTDKDFKPIAEYLNAEESKLIRILKDYSADESKLFDIKRSSINGVAEIKSVKILTMNKSVCNLFEEALTDYDILQNFYDFSIKVMGYDYENNNILPEIKGTHELVEGILSTWIRLSQIDKKEIYELCERFAGTVIDCPRLQNSSSLIYIAQIKPNTVYDKFKKLLADSIISTDKNKLQSLWRTWESPLTLIADYYWPLIIDDLWQTVLPIFIKFGLEDLILSFTENELTPWKGNTLLYQSELKRFLADNENNTTLLALSIKLLPRYTPDTHEHKPTSLIWNKKESNYHKIEPSEKKELINCYIEYAIKHGTYEAENLMKILRSAVLDYDISRFDSILKNFDTFSDDDKIRIELILREKVLEFEKTKQLEKSSIIQTFISSIKYENAYSKYVWLFTYQLCKFAPPYGTKIIHNLRNLDTRITEIQKYLDSEFTPDFLIEILNSPVATDFEAITNMYVEYAGARYNYDFLYALSKRTPETYHYIKDIINKNEDVTEVIISDFDKLSDKTDNQNIVLADTLSFLPFSNAKDYILETDNITLKRRFYNLLRIKWLNTGKMQKPEILAAMTDMHNSKLFDLEIDYIKYSPEYFTELEMIDILTDIKNEGGESTKQSFAYTQTGNNDAFSRIQRYTYTMESLYKKVINLELWYLEPEAVFTEHSISTLYMNNHPEYFIDLLKQRDDKDSNIEQLLLNKRCLILGNYKEWINMVIQLAENDCLKDSAYYYISYWIYYSAKQDGFEYVPIPEIAEIIERDTKDLSFYLQRELFNLGNSHIVDDGFFLNAKASKIEDEAESIQRTYPNLSRVLKSAAAEFRAYAKAEGEHDRYE